MDKLKKRAYRFFMGVVVAAILAALTVVAARLDL